MKLFYLMNPNNLFYYLKQFALIYKFKGRMTLASYRLSYGRLVQIVIERNAKIHLGKKIFLSKNVDIAAFDSAVITIGSNFFINKNSSIISRYGIDIGNDCMIGDNVLISDHNHTFSDLTIPFNQQGYYGKKIKIGNNIWIGNGVFIGSGVEIGDNVIIGAGTVVTKSIPSNVKVYNKMELVISPIYKRYE